MYCIVLYFIALHCIVLYCIVLYVCMHMHVCHMISSSAAHGGGGSFKNRKTIGEIGCCESRMTKQKD